MAFSGFRPMVLGNYEGSDGLRIGDVPDLVIDSKSKAVSFRQTPARIVVRQELSKANHTYSSFLGEEGCEYLSEYLTSRIKPNAEWKKGESLTKDSPLITPERANKDFVCATNIGDLVRSAIRKAGLFARPYSLRTTFATRLLSAEAEGAVPHSLAAFWMGHRGDMTARYAQNRGQLPPELIEQMRDAYRRSEPYLSSTETADVQRAIEKNLQYRMRVDMLKLIGVAEKEATELVQDPSFDIASFARARLGSSPATEIPSPKRTGEQRVIDADLTDRYLETGWTFKSPLNGTKAVVEWTGPMPSAA